MKLIDKKHFDKLRKFAEDHNLTEEELLVLIQMEGRRVLGIRVSRDMAN